MKLAALAARPSTTTVVRQVAAWIALAMAMGVYVATTGADSDGDGGAVEGGQFWREACDAGAVTDGVVDETPRRRWWWWWRKRGYQLSAGRCSAIADGCRVSSHRHRHAEPVEIRGERDTGPCPRWCRGAVRPGAVRVDEFIPFRQQSGTRRAKLRLAPSGNSVGRKQTRTRITASVGAGPQPSVSGGGRSRWRPSREVARTSRLDVCRPRRGTLVVVDRLQFSLLILTTVTVSDAVCLLLVGPRRARR